MKRYIGQQVVTKEKVSYPSTENPRLDLTPKNPAIQSLALSIEKNGLMVPPILRMVSEEVYETIDGDRRLIAVFDLLNWKEVLADVYVTDGEEADRMRLIANVDRQDLSSVEKGSYLWRFIIKRMEKEGKTPVEDYWSQRDIRGEYIRRLADDLAKSPSFVKQNITIWLDTPDEFRKWVARSKEEMKKMEYISPRKAYNLIVIGHSLGNVKKAFQWYYEPKPKTELGTKEFRLIRKAIRSGQIANFEQLDSFYERRLAEWDEIGRLMLRRTTLETASMLASELGVGIDRIVDASIWVGASHKDELKENLT
jgi:hypothetical protein